MINTSVNKNEHTIQSGVVDYPIGFPFYFNPDRTPQLLVKIGDEELRFNHNFKLSEDKGSVVLMPTEEESWTLEGPEDFSWMTKWDGKDLLIERVVPFVQDSDYQLGRISSEQIERDFDLSVMRDQILDDKISDVHDEFTEAKTELQKSIDDKLPLSGGVMTGQIEIETSEADRRVLTFRASNGVSHTIYADPNGVQMPFEIYSTRGIAPAHSGKYELGDWLNKWKTVYTTGLSNSASGFIAVPEKAGTMALLEDVEGKADKTELQNYLPLTGGTLTNLLSFDMPGTAGKNKGLIYVNTASGSVPLIGAKTDDNGALRDVAVIPNLQSTTFQATNLYASFIGSLSNPVTRIHAKKIGTGSITKLLTIPDGPGTIARIEDIPETYTKEELDAKFAEIPDSVDTYSKAEIDAKLSSVYKFKGSVASVDALPTDAIVGDTYNVEDTGANYAWDGSNWDKLSDTVDLTGYATEEYVDDNVFALMDYIDDEIRPLRTENKQLYNNQLVLRDMLNEKDENDEFIKLTTEAQSAIPAINELNAKIGAGGGGASLPDQTDNAGKFLTTDGATASWSDKPLVNKSTNTTSYVVTNSNYSLTTTVDYSVCLGYYSDVKSPKSVVVGYSASTGSGVTGMEGQIAIGPQAFASGMGAVALGGLATAGGWPLNNYAIALGSRAVSKADYAIQLGSTGSPTTNTDANTFKVANSNGNFEMMSADGTIPAERMSSTAGTTGQVLTKTEDGMAWQDATGGGGGSAEIGPELDVEYKLTSWFYGFNSSDGYIYFDNIYSADSPEDVSCFALTNQVYSGSPNISIVNRSYGISEDGQHYSFTEEWFGPGEYWPKNLGREEAPWQTVYATKLNNGADLELPTESGTLARIEDIDERIGDISTALTAILGE